MPKEKQYRNLYTEHCIRHPNDHVSYANFRWRIRHRGEKLAVKLGKLESAPKTAEKVAKKVAVKKSMHLAQKKAREEQARKEKIARIVIGILLVALGVVI